MAVSKKICLLGAPQVGKTSLAHRFVQQKFLEKYQPTDGIHVLRKDMSALTRQGIVEVALVVWDVTGDASSNMIAYLRGAAAAVLVCSVADPASLARLEAPLAQLRSLCPGAQLVLAATQSDRPVHQLSPAQLQACSQEWNAPLVATSAKTGSGVDALFVRLTQLLAEDITRTSNVWTP